MRGIGREYDKMGDQLFDGGCGECDDGFDDDYDARSDGGFNIAWLCFTGLVVLVYAKQC